MLVYFWWRVFLLQRRKAKKLSLPTLVHYLPTSLRRNKRSVDRNRADLKVWRPLLEEHSPQGCRYLPQCCQGKRNLSSQASAKS